jgi:hypothetical protein
MFVRLSSTEVRELSYQLAEKRMEKNSVAQPFYIRGTLNIVE